MEQPQHLHIVPFIITIILIIIIAIITMFFYVWEKWHVQSEATEEGEFRAKIPAFYCSLQRRFAHIQREKFYSKSFSR